jgi:hypothetical protein
MTREILDIPRTRFNFQLRQARGRRGLLLRTILLFWFGQ